MQLFYSEKISSSLLLSKEESNHCIKVLRKKINDIIFVTDGNEFLYKCKNTKIENNYVQVNIITKTQEKCQNKIELAISFPKQRNRIDWIIEKATELGVNIITPLICENSERTKVNIERMNKIAISSMKQSLRTYLPKISQIQTFSKYVQEIQYEQKYIAHCKPDSNKQKIENLKAKTACVLIGPEGDFSEGEIKIANDFNFKSITLSSKRLRTETAAIVACYQLTHKK